MIRLGKFLAILLAAVTAPAVAAADCAANALALPSELYMLPGSRNDLFTLSYMKRWMPYEFFARVGGDCSFERRIPKVSTILNPADGSRLTVDLVNGYDFSVLSSDTITIRVAGAAAGNGSGVTAQVLGDSFVQGAFYRAALVDSTLVPGIRTVGLRKLDKADGHFDEGRGGWTLKKYFSISKGEFTPYAGFMQPAGERRYLGDTRFWINCHKVERGELTDFDSRYNCGRFGDCCKRFDSATGLPVKPAKGDLLWDGERLCYVCFNGKKWEQVKDADEDSWSFDYPKYLAIWGLEAPDFLFETLGLNDFRDDMEADFSEWDRMVGEMKESYLKANPRGRFAIVIPCSTCGSMDNRRGDFTLRQNACMWRFRRHLIDTFDNRKEEGFYLVDMGITIDNDNGYRVDDEGLQVGNPHPYPNYPSMGMPLAAFIQYYRN